MNIIKIITRAELQVDSKSGKIWLNAPNCILRIYGLNFKNQKENFSMIDINGSNASMVEGNLVTSNIQNYVDEIITLVTNSNFTDEELKEILKLISSMKKEN